MGPVILLDKSALQCLSQEEAGFLTKHYYVHVPPILILEVLGDLTKYGEDKDRGEATVRTLAAKFGPEDSKVSANYRLMLVASLLGMEVPVTWQIPVVGGKEIIDRYGRKGTFFGEQEEEKALFRWRAGDFRPMEARFSEMWRKATTGFDLRELGKLLRGTDAYDGKLGSLEDLIRKVDELLGRTGYQARYIQWLLQGVAATNNIEKAVLERYQAHGFGPLKRFAPYAYHCCRVELAFFLGLANNLISTKATNRVDLEYLMYLPFCHVFSSGDKFLKAFSVPFLRDDQVLVDSMILKADLNAIAVRWSALSESEREEDAREYGSYPPVNSDSVTHQIWKRRMRPWSPGSGNIQMSKEEQERLIDYLQPMFEAIDRASK